MSGVEGVGGVAVLACVGGIVLAFKDGHAIVQTIKERRRARRGIPPSRYLEESLAAGPRAVEAQMEQGVEAFGHAFATGDEIAAGQLKDILIVLQTSLITNLRHAQDDDNVIDFSVLIKASDIGRISAVKTLCDLYMRLAEVAPIVQSPQSRHSSMRSIEGVDDNLQDRMYNDQAQTLQINGLDWPRAVSDKPYQASGLEPPAAYPKTDSYSPPVHTSTSLPPRGVDYFPFRPKYPHFSFFHRSKNNTHHGTKPELRAVGLSTSSPSAPPALHNAHPSSPPRMTRAGNASRDSEVPMVSTMSSPFVGGPFEMDEPNPWADALAEYPESDAPTTVHMARNESRSTASEEAPSHSSRELVKRMTEPTASNDFSGFCKGAFELQVGSKSMKKAKEMGPLTSDPIFWACPNSKCAYSGTAIHRHGEWVYDTSVRSSHGIRYRWVFLAKSHVKQTRVKHGVFLYKCIFCVLQNLDSPIFQNAATLMEHISTHRGDPFGETLLHRTKCVNDGIAPESDEFDINLVPPEHALGRSMSGDLRNEVDMMQLPTPAFTAFGPNDYG